MEENNESKKEKNWIERLHARSWEMELLVVGFALLILINIPDFLEHKIIDWKATISSDYVGVLIYFAQISVFVTYILMFNLVVHVLFRGFWIGIIGLNSVFPKEIDHNNLNFNSRFSKFIKEKVPGLKSFAVLIDNLSSSIFAFTFLIIFVFISISIYFLLIYLFLVIVINSTAPILSETIHDILSYFVLITILIPYLIAGVITATDFLGLGFLKRVRKTWFSKIHFKVVKIFRLLTLAFLYESIYYTLISNVSRKRIGIILSCYIAIVLFFVLTNYSELSYYSNVNNEYKLTYGSYENKNQNVSRIVTPTIQSDVIKDGYIELFIPYDLNNNSFFENKYPGIKPFRKSGLKTNFTITVGRDTIGVDTTSINEKSKLVLELINSFYNIAIDDSIYANNQFYFYRHEKNKEPGYFTVLYVENLEKGNHLLSIKKNIDDEDIEIDNTPYYIPFWVK